MINPSRSFLELSAEIGNDPLQVQGPGGNTSIKHYFGNPGDNDGKLWVKASGTWLKDAADKDIFSCVGINEVLSSLDEPGESDLGGLVPEGAPRPSIETTFHALLAHPVVLHTHSVNTIAHAISDDGLAKIRQKLQGRNWELIPYRKPGAELARCILEIGLDNDSSINVNRLRKIAIKREKFQKLPDALAIVLSNHGLIVSGNGEEQAAVALREIEELLRMEPLWESTGKKFGCPAGWAPVPRWSCLGTNELCARRATAGSYYPDHVVFLGHALPLLDDPQEAASLDPGRLAAIVSGVGVMAREDARPAAIAMLGCLHDVLCRIPEDWSLNALTLEHEAELLDWDAEKYRQDLEAGR